MDTTSIIGKVKAYASERTATMRQGGALVATSVVLLAIACSSDFQFKGLLGIEGEIHNGYIAAYGQFILLALGAVYSWRFADCLALRQNVLADLPAEILEGPAAH